MHGQNKSLLGFFTGSKSSDKTGEIYLNEIILCSMPNGWSRQAYVQVFNFEGVIFNQTTNMFDPMETDESIYEGVVEPSYQKN